MGIKLFVNILLALGIAAYFIPVENRISENTDKDIPLVVFEEPLMFTLTEDSVTKVVDASKAIKYKNRDEMFDADIIIKNTKKNKKYNLDKLNAKMIISHGDILTLKEKVFYRRDNFMTLNTEKLYYNTKQKVAYNDIAFNGKYNGSTIKGTNLYLDMNKNNFKSKKVHFEIDMKNKK
ncbi:LPS export ABC transporter periplasmic protein LptC [Poseidonibacter lekithochrous]|uniref:LPS export ABC transporter periplasmic protein LptC n=1 Tax=Poseidonibacter lekithochrous TaxID=1904463 RepID=UPI0008FC3F8F|nr:LPS export ABC transporter periplasmic protein LptC [Poseidonibacter lekithochrous]QKJ23427.1 lipooligosaccharide transport system, periplasmic component LptC [Poseidonibacter lekithochrous]